MTKPLVFIVEDQRDLLQLYVDALESIGYATQAYRDGQEALDALMHVDPALIILDINLPHVSGHYIYKQILATEKFKHTVVLISTANNIMAEKISFQVRAHDFVKVKPITIAELSQIAKSSKPKQSTENKPKNK